MLSTLSPPQQDEDAEVFSTSEEESPASPSTDADGLEESEYLLKPSHAASDVADREVTRRARDYPPLDRESEPHPGRGGATGARGDDSAVGTPRSLQHQQQQDFVSRLVSRYIFNYIYINTLLIINSSSPRQH